MRAAVLRRLRKEEKGFTLIELLAVIVILGVIAAIAIPLIGNVIDKSKKDSDISAARQIYDAARLYVTSEAKQTKGGTTDLQVTLDELQDGGYLESNIVLPSTKDKITGAVVDFLHTDGSLLYVSYTTASDGTSSMKYYKGEDIMASNSNVDPATSTPTPPAAS